MTKEQIKLKLRSIANKLSTLEERANDRYKYLKKKFNLNTMSQYAYRYGYVAEGINIAIQDLELLLRIM